MAKYTERKITQAVYAFELCRKQQQEMGERLDATRRLFKKKVLAVDIHSHSLHSDGDATIAENCKDAKEQAKLDFLFCTDHSTLTQRRDVGRYTWAGLGQESHSGGYDIGLLHPTAVHAALDGIADGVATARDIADFVWIPHPVGFGGLTDGDLDRAVKDLSTVDRPAIEVLNGFAAPTRAFPRTGRWGVRLFDRLLCLGKQVTPLGAGDSHFRIEIGNAWTGVFASKCDAPSIIKALLAGRCFASEAPLVSFSCNGKPMGTELRVKKGGALRFELKAADAYGLMWARVISGGRTIKEFRLNETEVFDGTFEQSMGSKAAYYRFEVVAADDRRAFSAPIYTRF